MAKKSMLEQEIKQKMQSIQQEKQVAVPKKKVHENIGIFMGIIIVLATVIGLVITLLRWFQ